MIEFRKLMVANRGEIAIRVSAGPTSWASAPSPFIPTRTASPSTASRPTRPISSARPASHPGYLDIAGIIELAPENQVDAIHPGYGFV